MNLFALIPAPYRMWAYAVAAVAALALFGWYSAWVYGKGEAAVQTQWNANRAEGVLASRDDQLKIGVIDLGLQEKLDENRDNQPTITVVDSPVGPVPDCMRDGAGLPAAAGHPRSPAKPRADPEAAAVGEAIAHDAGHYASCWAKLSAAQAALKVLAGRQ